LKQKWIQNYLIDVFRPVCVGYYLELNYSAHFMAKLSFSGSAKMHVVYL